jgi:hypothetical protein
VTRITGHKESSAFRQLRKRPVLVKDFDQETQNQGKAMAGNGDMKAHQETYLNVMSLFRWATLGIFIVGAIVVLLIGG